jgi:hypothetical protein
MPFPRPGTFGIVENPLIFTPFSQGNSSSGGITDNDFLLMDGEFFLLMDGTHFLLMGI